MEVSAIEPHPHLTRLWLDRARFEAVLGGRWPYLAAPVTLLGFAALGVLFGSTARLVVAGLETGVPLAAGLATASLLAAEPALELQLSVKGGVRPAIVVRAAALFTWSALCSATALLLAQLSGLFGDRLPSVGPVLLQLLWLAPLAAFIVAGILLAVAFRSRAMASGALMTFWVAGHSFHDVFVSSPPLRAWYPFLTVYAGDAPDWVATRLTLLGLAAVSAAVAAAWLGAGEWLLAAEDR
jgi:hypothetical protein